MPALPGEPAVLIVGDVHGQWGQLADLLMKQEIRTTTIIQVGDLGVGFRGWREDIDQLLALDAVLAARDLTLLAIRGNHDNPRWWSRPPHALAGLRRVRLVPDYHVETVEGRVVLFVGGATSVDRVIRQRRRLPWWPAEGFAWRPRRLAGLPPPEVVVTHTAPDHCPPHGFAPLVLAFARYDATLLDDLRRERAQLTMLHDALDRSRLRHWLYGHFHYDMDWNQAGVNYRCLAELGVAWLPPGVSGG